MDCQNPGISYEMLAGDRHLWGKKNQVKVQQIMVHEEYYITTLRANLQVLNIFQQKSKGVVAGYPWDGAVQLDVGTILVSFQYCKFHAHSSLRQHNQKDL